MTKNSCRRLNNIPKPQAPKGIWALYILFTAFDLASFILSLYACNGEFTGTKKWLLVKFGGILIFRLLFVVEFIEYRLAFNGLQRHIVSKDQRFDSRMGELFVSRHEYGALIAGVFETICTVGIIVVLMDNTQTHRCDLVTIIAWTSIAITLIGYVTCVYKSCLGCHRRDSETL